MEEKKGEGERKGINNNNNNNNNTEEQGSDFSTRWGPTLIIITFVIIAVYVYFDPTGSIQLSYGGSTNNSSLLLSSPSPSSSLVAPTPVELPVIHEPPEPPGNDYENYNEEEEEEEDKAEEKEEYNNAYEENINWKLPHVLFFLHIQKAGGSTLRRIFWNNIYDTRLEWFGWTEYDKMGFKKKSELRRRWRNTPAIMGHFLYGIQAITNRRPYSYVTVVRNGFDRVVSHFYWLKSVHGSQFWDYLEQWIQRDKKYFLSDNHQTRVLCGPSAFFKPRHGLSQEDVDCAIKHLKTFQVVLINEVYDISVTLLGKVLDWRRLKVVQEKVVSGVHGAEANPEKYHLSKKDVELIKNATYWDDKLYEAAVDIFIEQLKENGLEIYLPEVTQILGLNQEKHAS